MLLPRFNGYYCQLADNNNKMEPKKVLPSICTVGALTWDLENTIQWALLVQALALPTVAKSQPQPTWISCSQYSCVYSSRSSDHSDLLRDHLLLQIFVVNNAFELSQVVPNQAGICYDLNGPFTCIKDCVDQVLAPKFSRKWKGY